MHRIGDLATPHGSWDQTTRCERRAPHTACTAAVAVAMVMPCQRAVGSSQQQSEAVSKSLTLKIAILATSQWIVI
jgi:hypothetical protein